MFIKKILKKTSSPQFTLSSLGLFLLMVSLSFTSLSPHNPTFRFFFIVIPILILLFPVLFLRLAAIFYSIRYIKKIAHLPDTFLEDNCSVKKLARKLSISPTISYIILSLVEFGGEGFVERKSLKFVAK